LRRLLQWLPNTLTIMRLLLAIPIGFYIARQEYDLALWLVLGAGLSDGVDGWLARRLNAMTRFGAIADPLSDKALMSAAFIGLAWVGLIPWWLTAVVIGRDLIIVCGAVTYHLLVGPVKVSPSRLSKFNTLLQICFSVSLLLNQVFPLLPNIVFVVGTWLILAMALVTGADYVFTWSRKGRQDLHAHLRRNR